MHNLFVLREFWTAARSVHPRFLYTRAKCFTSNALDRYCVRIISILDIFIQFRACNTDQFDLIWVQSYQWYVNDRFRLTRRNWNVCNHVPTVILLPFPYFKSRLTRHFLKLVLYCNQILLHLRLMSAFHTLLQSHSIYLLLNCCICGLARC